MEQPAYTVVVAEDEELLLHNLVEKIHRTGLGFHVAATAQTGLQAYEAVKEHNPDLLVTDIRMPVMDGYEATRAIRTSNRPDSGLPIIAMTADAFVEDIRNAENAGMNGHMAKPLSFDTLALEIEKYLTSAES